MADPELLQLLQNLPHFPELFRRIPPFPVGEIEEELHKTVVIRLRLPGKLLQWEVPFLIVLNPPQHILHKGFRQTLLKLLRVLLNPESLSQYFPYSSRKPEMLRQK